MKRAADNRARMIFTLIGVTVFGIWLALLIMNALGIVGHLVFLGAAAWLFELYSAAQRESLKYPTRTQRGMEERLQEFEEENNL